LLGTLKNLVIDNNIDVFYMHKIELENGYPAALLSFPNFNLEVEESSVKARVGIYINNQVNYVSLTIKE
jgi:hypothetical protein